MSHINPYELQVPRDGHSPISQARRLLEPFCAEHIEGFGAALDGRVAKDQAKRTLSHQMLRIGMAAATQARQVAMEVWARSNPLMSGGTAGFEAALNTSTLNANITAFVTQWIHMSLDVYPRLLAPNFVSVQPFSQPSGFLFFMKSLAGNNSDSGTGQNRELSDLDTFDKEYGLLVTEGQQLRTVKQSLSKELVEVQYYGLMHQQSHQVDVALRSQYGLDLLSMGDQTTARELAWEVDRVVIDDLIAFALTNPLGVATFDPTRTGTYDGLSPSEQNAYDQTFISKTMTAVEVDSAANIYVAPNWYLGGSNMIKLLRRTPGAMSKDAGGNMLDQMPTRGSVLQAGTLMTGEKVWFDPQMNADLMIAGHTDNMDPFYAGYIFSPFGLASLLTAAFQDPDNLLTKKARALAFAKMGVNNKQYRAIRLGTS